jgi:hypothetical protein
LRGFRRTFSDLAGIRTQDPILKRDVLYLLSYQISIFFEGAKIEALFEIPKII